MLRRVQVLMSSIGRLICPLSICLGCLRGVCDYSTWRRETQTSADVMPGKISFVDLSGAPQAELMAALSASSFDSTYLVTPVPMYLTLPQGISSCMALKRLVFPHLDLDHIPETVQAGGYEALSLGIYAVEWSCIAVGLATQEPL